jgi:cytidylate kinase
MADENKAQEVIQTIVGAELFYETEHDRLGDKPAPPLVTVSRFFGAQGTDISRMLAQRLGVPLYDRELLTAVVHSTKADPALLERLDERTTGLVSNFLHTFFLKNAPTADDFYHSMIKVILGISHTGGGVIVGRGAHLLLPRRKAFRLRLDGSMSVCATRVSKLLHIPLNQAEQLIRQTNRERTEFVKQVYKRFTTTKTYYDLVINTDLHTAESAVDVIHFAMYRSGFNVPKPTC